MNNVIAITRDADAEAIGNLYRKAGRAFIDSIRDLHTCGAKLQAKKEELGHGDWLPWLKLNRDALGFGDWTASRLLWLANQRLAPNLTEEEALKLSRKTWGHEPKQIESKPKKKKVEPDTYITPEIDDEDQEEARVEGNLPNSTRIRGLMQRAREAIEMAETDNMRGVPVSEAVIALVYEAATAWVNLGKSLTTENDNG